MPTYRICPLSSPPPKKNPQQSRILIIFACIRNIAGSSYSRAVRQRARVTRNRTALSRSRKYRTFLRICGCLTRTLEFSACTSVFPGVSSGGWERRWARKMTPRMPAGFRAERACPRPDALRLQLLDGLCASSRFESVCSSAGGAEISRYVLVGDEAGKGFWEGEGGSVLIC